jgi:hypothetical protein
VESGPLCFSGSFETQTSTGCDVVKQQTCVLTELLSTAGIAYGETEGCRLEALKMDSGSWGFGRSRSKIVSDYS